MTAFQIVDLSIGSVLSAIMVGLFVVAGISKAIIPAVVCVACGLGMGLIAAYFFYNALKK